MCTVIFKYTIVRGARFEKHLFEWQSTFSLLKGKLASQLHSQCSGTPQICRRLKCIYGKTYKSNQSSLSEKQSNVHTFLMYIQSDFQYYVVPCPCTLCMRVDVIILWLTLATHSSSSCQHYLIKYHLTF